MWVQSLSWEDPLEEGTATLQFSCLENPMDKGAWKAPVHRVPKSWTQLNQFSMNSQSHYVPQAKVIYVLEHKYLNV